MQKSDITSFSSFAIIDKINTAGVIIYNKNTLEYKDKKFLNSFLNEFSKKKLGMKNSSNCFIIEEVDALEVRHFLKQEFEQINQILLYKNGKLYQSANLSKLYESYIKLSENIDKK